MWVVGEEATAVILLEGQELFAALYGDIELERLSEASDRTYGSGAITLGGANYCRRVENSYMSVIPLPNVIPKNKITY